MTLTMTSKKCAFFVQMLGQRLTTLSKICVSQTSLKENLSQLFVISPRILLNPNFLKLLPVSCSTLEAVRRKVSTGSSHSCDDSLAPAILDSLSREHCVTDLWDL